MRKIQCWSHLVKTSGMDLKCHENIITFITFGRLLYLYSSELIWNNHYDTMSHRKGDFHASSCPACCMFVFLCLCLTWLKRVEGTITSWPVSVTELRVSRLQQNPHGVIALVMWVSSGLWILMGLYHSSSYPECNSSFSDFRTMHFLRMRYACVNTIWLTEVLKCNKFSSRAQDSCTAT